MSKATNQTLILLSMANGAMVVMIDNDMVDGEVKEKVLAVTALIDDLLEKYPATGDPFKNMEWIRNHFSLWSKLINEQEKTWTPFVLTSMALFIITDLAEKINNRDVLKVLNSIRDSLYGLSDMLVADESDEFVPLEEADDLIRKFYNIIGFNRV